MVKWSFIIVLSFCCFSIAQPATTPNTITTEDVLTHNETKVSDNGNFVLGFFQPDNSSSRWYLGIWYQNISPRTVVWVANRKSPLTDSSGVLRLTTQGVLVLENGNRSAVWSSTQNSSGSGISPVAQLLDSGNLVVKSDAKGGNSDGFLWQSFDYPTDNLLAGMLLGRNISSGYDWYLTSWSSLVDPSPGTYAFRIYPDGFPQLLLTQGSGIKFRLGPWNGIRFAGAPNLNPNPYYKYSFVLNETAMYYSYKLLNSTVITRLYLDPTGVVQRLIWTDLTHGWLTYVTEPIDSCDAYAYCGAHASCNVNKSPVCGCLKGFEPKNPGEWAMVKFSNGCVRKKQLECGTDKFIKYSNIKLPDTKDSWYSKTLSLRDCGIKCKRDCSCMAYSTLNISDGSGCLLWYGELLDIKDYNENGQDVYIRMSASEPGFSGYNQKKRALIIGLVSTAAIIILGFACTMYFRKKRRKSSNANKETILGVQSAESKDEELDLPIYDLETVSSATNNFSAHNKLGEGGFGPVYKGVLSNGQEIAVKKLSVNSKQGMDEFKNEVSYIAKLQHRNLVKILGCCIQEENMLIYEYMPNKSLNAFIFDPAQRKQLTWKMRFHIINGIAKGLLYLHQDSRLRIVHRDLKASNILLDDEMNPKIADFGLARSFGGKETQANTNRVVGTYGYMSPEYAIDGVFSVKSDVYSYGVLVLETISGKRNRGFMHLEHHHNLLGHAWLLFMEQRSLELLDEFVINDSYDMSEVLRSIHVALLCVQRMPEDRPTMSSVFLMLGSDGVLPTPKEPGFFNERKPAADSTSSQSWSANEISMTLLSAR